MIKQKSVLFVCTANRCRSPMAEALFIHMLGDQAGEWRIASAGTWAELGDPPIVEVEQVLTAMDIDIHDHRSQPVSRDLLEGFNLILTMEHGHKEGLRVEFPHLKSRIHLISEMVGGQFEIRDPVGGPMIEYQETLRELDRILQRGFDKITRLASK